MSADGARIAFVSTDFTGPDGTTIFSLFDTNTDTLTQIASFTESQLGRRLVSSMKISADGSRVAFSSQGNLTGQNADGNLEVFLFTVATGTLIQLTNTTTGGNFVSSLNADGSQIIVSSSSDPTQENPYGNPELLRVDVNTGVFTPVIHTPFTFRVFIVSLNADATGILFSTSADPTGENPDGNEEVFLLDTTTDSLAQITKTTTGNSFPLALSPDGTRIVIESTANLAGENVAQTFQLFLFDIPTATFTQISHATEGFFDFTSFFSADGARIIFTSPANLLGNNLDIDEPNSSLASKIFLFDTTTRVLTQITRNGSSSSPAVSADGSRIAFSFAPRVILVGADLLGYNNPVTSDVTYPLFLAKCALPDAQSPAIIAAVESPEPGPVSGVALIRGWAFAVHKGVGIDKVTLLIDGLPIGDAPCCSERADVSAAFPQFPEDNTHNSGWGMIFNWGTLNPGPHIVRGQIRNTTGELLSTEPRTITVVRPGDFEYLDQLSFARATARIAGDKLILEGVEVRDKTTQQQKQVDVRYRWFTNSQSLQAVEAVTMTTLSSSRSFFAELFAAPSARFIGLPTVAAARAAPGLVQAFESPEENQVASGIGIIRGWAFADAPDAAIREIRLMIDGQPGSVVPCCTPRGDVAASYPENPSALNSGWGLTVNYGNLPEGPHTIGVRLEDSTGASLALDRNVRMVKIGGSEFLDQFDLSGATAQIVHPWGGGDEIIVDGVRVRDKASQQSRVVSVRLHWFQSSQGFGIVASTS
jgi:Tol biopolymer transport system component